jgi:hypothetical protein
MRTTSLIGALLLSLLVAANIDKAHAGVLVSVTVAPPPLVVYAQPPLPGPGYIWTPGYWGWDGDAGDYYWVPGAWVLAPEADMLWTPGYWGWGDGVYVWHDGYWGPHVGFYGGVNYGYGYGGVGFEGGYWHGGVYTYNRNVVNVGLSVNVAVYSKAVAHGGGSQTSFNGGNGGVNAKPTPQERAFANEHHIGPSQQQHEHRQLAGKNPDLRFAHNAGKPAIAATSKAGDFSKGHTFAAKSAGTGFKPTSLKTQSAPTGRKAGVGAGAGARDYGAMNHAGKAGAGTGAKQFRSSNHAATSGKPGGADFGTANRFHTSTVKQNNLPRGGAMQGVRRSAPPPRPAFRPVAKAPAGNYKKPQH